MQHLFRSIATTDPTSTTTTPTSGLPMIDLTPSPQHRHGGVDNELTNNSKYSFDRVFLNRFYRILQVLFQSASNQDRFYSLSPKARQKSLFWLYIAFIALASGVEVLYYYVGLTSSRFYAILTSQDLGGFTRFIIPCMLLVFGTAAGKSLLSYMGGLFSLKVRRILTQHLHDCYIKPKTLYPVVTSPDAPDNPDQRIAQDIEKFADALREIVENLIISPVLVAYYTWKCWSVTGALGPIMIYGYFVVGSVLSQLLIRPIVNSVFYKELAEGNFRFLHVRLRQFAEAIAFSRGEREEHARAKESLETLLRYQRQVINKELPLHLSNESFSYFGSVLSYLIVAMPIFAGAFKDKDASELSAIISQNSFFSMYLIFRFTTIIEQSVKLSDLAGYCARIGELLEVIDDVDDELNNVAVHHPRNDIDEYDSSTILFDNVRLVSPQGKLLVSEFNLEVSSTDRVVIVGPNGSGKSSLLRALAGLWQCNSGRIHVPKDIFGTDFVFLPQIPYLIDGSLREQILYPNNSSTIALTDNQIRELLHQVELEHLESMLGSFDARYGEEWQKMLSPGEQQRLMFTRILYWQPRFAVLDEATSAMDINAETHLYSLLAGMDIAIISISHHPQIVNYHNKIVTLDGRGGFTVDETTPSSPKQ
ncbi:ABC transporter transmembrane region 2-domain-containing protein [Zychaea mexicana]|uniref:ABC transporter transmembrane region 2-domain-containing protein n=1 Tax=Zychaea mexicana TaxID=64656 RepID=UPI0022FE32CC|nr:ABC transporter transmembrane region 2-domain-containing protein [Zychaea mexicana]KAI9498583.1 ABC transporter transmembrane region 2-domain-containing protein [Zychaea mexicana]